MRRRALSLGLLTLITVAGGGCGWTMRDEFYAARAVTLPPHAGDGSRLSAAPSASERALAEDLSLARR